MKASTTFHADGPGNGLWEFRITEKYVVAANPSTVMVHGLACPQCKADKGQVCSNHHVMFEVGQTWDAQVQPQSHLLLTSHRGPEGKISLWALEDGSHIRDFVGGSPVLSVLFLDPDSSFASGFEDGTIRLWKRTQDEPTHVLRGHNGQITRMIAYPGGIRLISAANDGTVRVWDTATGQQVHLLDGHADYFSVLSVSPDLTRLRSSCGRTGHLCIWDLEDGTLVAKIDPAVRQMPQISDVQGQMVTSGVDGKIRTWTRDGVLLKTVEAGSVPIRGIVHFGEKLAVVAGSGDGRVRVWDWEKKEPLFDLDDPLRMVYTIISDGKKLGITSHDTLHGPVERDAPEDWPSVITSRIQVWDLEEIREFAAKRHSEDL